jgi:hypothetical protein
VRDQRLNRDLTNLPDVAVVQIASGFLPKL